MELKLAPFARLAMLALAMAVTLSIAPSRAQISTPCNASMIASFTPCMNFVTNSSTNGTSPTQDCCNALKTLTGSSMDCLCLIVTGSVPFQVPINRTLAISLPRACNMPGVPVQCRATGAPIPAPAPSAFGPTLSPGASPAASPSGSTDSDPISPALSPISDTTPLLTPPSTTSGAETPSENPESRPVLTPPSAAAPTLSLSNSVFLFAIGFLAMKLY